MIIFTVNMIKLIIDKEKKILAPSANPKYSGKSAVTTETPARIKVAISVALTKRLGILVLPSIPPGLQINPRTSKRQSMVRKIRSPAISVTAEPTIP